MSELVKVTHELAERKINVRQHDGTTPRRVRVTQQVARCVRLVSKEDERADKAVRKLRCAVEEVPQTSRNGTRQPCQIDAVAQLGQLVHDSERDASSVVQQQPVAVALIIDEPRHGVRARQMSNRHHADAARFFGTYSNPQMSSIRKSA